MADKFIQSAIKHPGALTRKARAAGQSIDEYAKAHQHDGDETGQQARFYLGVLKPASKQNADADTMDEREPSSEREAAIRYANRRRTTR